MKKHILFTLISILVLQVHAQQKDLQLISTAGGFIQSAQGSVSFSIGEPVIGTITGAGYVINQGFQQPNQTPCTIAGYNPFPAAVYSRLDSLKLDAGAGYSKYAWVTGDSSQSVQVRYSGTYHVTVTDVSGCTASDTVKVQFPDTLGLHVSTVAGLCNRSVDVPVRASTFRHLLTLQGSVNWSSTDLRFDSISSYGASALQLNAANFGVSQTSNGRLTFSWNEGNGAGLKLTDTATLFVVRFTVLGTTVRSIPVTVTGTPTDLESYDAGLVKKTVIPTAGAVNVTCDFVITGKVLTPMNHGVRNVTVTLTGGTSPLSATTDSSGSYSFKVQAGTYTLTPAKTYEQQKVNGISTLDIALIQAHILQRTPLNAAYKVIAADVNNSSSITTADILSLRRVILGTDTTMPNNRIWAFVDGDQTFATISNPFPFSTTKTLTNQWMDLTHTFRGIKIGDVNYDRNPLLDQAPSGDTLRLFGEWMQAEDGFATLRVKSHAVNGLLGWQSTLRWDADQLSLQSAQGRMSSLGIGDRWKDNGYLTLSWNDPMAEGLNVTEGVEWLELKFKKNPQLKRSGLSISEEKLSTEAFNKHYQSMGVKMEPVELRGSAWNGMLRVYPNPATTQMNVEWKMEKAGSATVRLLDAQGRVVHVQRGEFGAGVQRTVIRRASGWSVSGTWMVQVECDGVLKNVPVVLAGEEPMP
jgi:hypothetical protein